MPAIGDMILNPGVQVGKKRDEAQKAITSQNREIATLNAMLRKMGKPAR